MPRPRLEPSTEEISERLADAIHRRGTQKDLARLLGLSEATVSRWISRGGLGSWERLRRICLALDTSADELLGLPERTALVEELERLEELEGRVRDLERRLPEGVGK